MSETGRNLSCYHVIPPVFLGSKYFLIPFFWLLDGGGGGIVFIGGWDRDRVRGLLTWGDGAASGGGGVVSGMSSSWCLT